MTSTWVGVWKVDGHNTYRETQGEVIDLQSDSTQNVVLCCIFLHFSQNSTSSYDHKQLLISYLPCYFLLFYMTIGRSLPDCLRQCGRNRILMIYFPKQQCHNTHPNKPSDSELTHPDTKINHCRWDAPVCLPGAMTGSKMALDH